LALAKREKKREGVTFLFYGESASGKTPTALSFPNQFLVDSDSGTKFYGGENVLTESNTLVFQELNEDLDEFENDSELFEQVETINIDSITRFAENMSHAALKVVELRAMSNARMIEGEGLSPKEYGVMKLHYDRFFARMLTYAKQGKNLVFVAEVKDKNENKLNAKGEQISVKVGEIPSMQKDSKYDFDVVVKTYIKEGKPVGVVEKDRTQVFNVGDIVDKPNYNHWKSAIAKAQKGVTRSKDEIKSFDETVGKEADKFDGTIGDKANELIKGISKIIDVMSPDQQKEMAVGFKEKFKTTKFKELRDVNILQAMLDYVEALPNT
jgi:hypothetical protein